MKPQEIAELTKQAPFLRKALSIQKRTLWHFLREQVEADWQNGSTYCERCQVGDYPLLKSPYNAPVPGWCIECILHGYWHDLPHYEPPEEVVVWVKAGQWTPTRFCYTAEEGWQVMDEHGVWQPIDSPPWTYPS